jgi:hypothetical protein
MTKTGNHSYTLKVTVPAYTGRPAESLLRRALKNLSRAFGIKATAIQLDPDEPDIPTTELKKSTSKI